MIGLQLLAVIAIGAIGGGIECLLRFDSGVFAEVEFPQQLQRASLFGGTAGLIGVVLLVLVGRIARKDAFDLKSIFSIALLFMCGFAWRPILLGVPTYVDQILTGREAKKTEQKLAGELTPAQALDAAGKLIESAQGLPSPIRRAELIAVAENAAVEQTKDRVIDEATIEAAAHFTSTASRVGQLNAVGKLADALAQSREQPLMRQRALDAIVQKTPLEHRAEIRSRIEAIPIEP